MDKKYTCSADEYAYLKSMQEKSARVRDKALTMKPGTAAYESHKQHDGAARLYARALEVFTIRPGSQPSPDGSGELSVEFQKDFDRFVADQHAK